MAKKTKDDSVFGDDLEDAVAPVAGEQTENVPTLEELRAAPKTMPVEGKGPGGRTWVLVSGKDGPCLRRPRQGDESRPICPMCSNDELAVLTGAYSSPTAGQIATTRYRCPVCTFSTQILRPGVADSLRKRSGASVPFVERPS